MVWRIFQHWRWVYPAFFFERLTTLTACDGGRRRTWTSPPNEHTRLTKAMRALRELGFTSNFLVMQSMLNKAEGKQITKMAVFDIVDLRSLCHVQERRSHSRQCYQREGMFQIMAFGFKRSLAPLSCQRVAGGRLMLMILALLTSPESLFCAMHKVKKWSRCRDPVRASIF